MLELNGKTLSFAFYPQEQEARKALGEKFTTVTVALTNCELKGVYTLMSGKVSWKARRAALNAARDIEFGRYVTPHWGLHQYAGANAGWVYLPALEELMHLGLIRNVIGLHSISGDWACYESQGMGVVSLSNPPEDDDSENAEDDILVPMSNGVLKHHYIGTILDGYALRVSVLMSRNSETGQYFMGRQSQAIVLEKLLNMEWQTAADEVKLAAISYANTARAAKGVAPELGREVLNARLASAGVIEPVAVTKTARQEIKVDGVNTALYDVRPGLYVVRSSTGRVIASSANIGRMKGAQALVKYSNDGASLETIQTF